MNAITAIKERRTIRKFLQKEVSVQSLEILVDCARLAAFPANVQPLKFGIISDKKICDSIFPHTKWAGYLENGTPAENERPLSYIAIFGDNDIKGSFEVEAGAAITNMCLAATDMGLGSCWFGSINREEIVKILEVPERYSLLYILAVGYPAQESKAVDIKNNDVKYFLDENNILNVPKRTLNEVLLFK